ncbi:hypothetical protein F5B20DRAFT_564196 [Whalleya microplaca]|nr:hypothetical protein F5B20DRAFT_564196 [Whalleya microplaca]
MPIDYQNTIELSGTRSQKKQAFCLSYAVHSGSAIFIRQCRRRRSSDLSIRSVHLVARIHTLAMLLWLTQLPAYCTVPTSRQAKDPAPIVRQIHWPGWWEYNTMQYNTLCMYKWCGPVSEHQQTDSTCIGKDTFSRDVAFVLQYIHTFGGNAHAKQVTDTDPAFSVVEFVPVEIKKKTGESQKLLKGTAVPNEPTGRQTIQYVDR